MIYYIDVKNEWWNHELVAFEHKGNFHVSPAFAGLSIDENTNTVNINGKSYLIKSDSNYAAEFFSDEELAFMIRCQGEFDGGEWDDVLTDELVKRAVERNCEAVYKNAVDILGVEI